MYIRTGTLLIISYVKNNKFARENLVHGTGSESQNSRKTAKQNPREGKIRKSSD
jgi:hypothetical protein